MKSDDWLLKEYEVMRLEITERVKLLHHFIAMAVYLMMVSTIIAILLVWFGGSPFSLVLFLLLLPVIFTGLTFNYQANQMTLEVLAGYSNSLIKVGEAAKAWDDVYGHYKRMVRLTSFLKVVPLLIPQLIPFFVIYYVGWPRHGGLAALLILDLVLFFLVIINFRYKWRS